MWLAPVKRDDDHRLDGIFLSPVSILKERQEPSHLPVILTGLIFFYSHPLLLCIHLLYCLLWKLSQELLCLMICSYPRGKALVSIFLC